MAVTQDDVRHVAELARLGIDESRLDGLVIELNGILGHMDVLSQVDTTPVESASAVTQPAEGTRLRSDSSGPLPMLTSRESFAPSIKDGLFIVPRLASHEDTSDSAP